LRLPFPLSLAGLAVLLTFAIAGSAYAREQVRPDRPVSVQALRSLADHYRTTTWLYQRAAHVKPTPTAFSYRVSTDPQYLQWTIDTWTRRAYVASHQALARIHRTLDVAIPAAPRLHSRLGTRVTFARRVTLKLRRIYPGSVTHRFASAHASSGTATLRLWQTRLAHAALAVARHGRPAPKIPRIPAFLRSAFLCIHHYEGAWTSNTGNGYYGGLQMDVAFQSRYGGEYLRRWGTADGWPVWAQLHAAVRAYRSGRGFYPWPNTARACGLI
jgi:hypothetical protein